MRAEPKGVRSGVLSSKHYRQGNGSPVTPDAIVHVVDDDEPTRDLLRLLLKTVGLQTATYALPSEFMKNSTLIDPAASFLTCGCRNPTVSKS